MDKIQELEKQLAEIKKDKQKAEWHEYLDKIKAFCENLVGKDIIRWYSNGGFCIFRVTGYKEQYYADQVGFNGQWHPRRWYELETTGQIHCRVSNDQNFWYKGEVKHQNRGIIKRFSRGKTEIPDAEYSGFDTCGEFWRPRESIRLGYQEYESQEPNAERCMSNFSVFARFAPEGMYDKAKAIADENLLRTKEFWEEFQSKSKNLKNIYE